MCAISKIKPILGAYRIRKSEYPSAIISNKTHSVGLAGMFYIIKRKLRNLTFISS